MCACGGGCPTCRPSGFRSGPMTKPEWKPGDLAMVKNVSGREFRAVRHSDNDGWTELPDNSWFRDGLITEVRPLVVIDPEDRERVERLIGLYNDIFNTRTGRSGSYSANAVGDLQHALRSLVTPPKPEEPTGLGAVVEDADRLKWLRAFGDVGYFVWHSERVDTAPQQWHSIDAVKVLSEGVQP